jgi:hypothetical protein
MIVIGYKYETEEEAVIARETCDAYYNIPVNTGDVTEHWVNYLTAELDTPIFWYIRFHESLTVVLGEPKEFDVTIEPI